jgi:hypothetical protein
VKVVLAGRIDEESEVELVSSREKKYEQRTVVKAVEQRFRTVVVRGFGKDAETEDVPNGWWITFTDSLTAVRCEEKPDCQAGDVAICTWEFRKP